MTRDTPRDLARRLKETPASEPPADLLARLRADVPPRLDLAAEPPRRAGRRLPPAWLRAAAVVVLALGGAWTLWRLSDPVLAPQAAVEEASGATEAGGGAHQRPPSAGAPPAARWRRGAPPDTAAEARQVEPAPEPERRQAHSEPRSTTATSAPPALPVVASPPPPAAPARAAPPRRAAAAPVPAYARLTSRIEVIALDGERRAAGAEVSLLLPDGSVRRDMTDPNGQLQFGDLEAGRYLVRAPATAGVAPATRSVEILGGRTGSVQVVLQVGDVTPVRVVVRDEGRMPLPGATVRVTPSAAPPRTAGAQGRLDLDLAPGRYRLVASLAGFEDRVVELEVPAGSGGAPLEVDVLLPRGRVEEIVAAGGGQAAFSDAISVVGEAPELPPAAMTTSTAAPKRVAHEPPPPLDVPPPVPGPHHAPFFRHSGVHPIVDTAEDRLSTFGLDVDTGSWGLVQAHLRRGELPPPGAVRVEEVVNALDYGDPVPARGETFRVTAEGAPSPFAPGPDHRLLRFGIQARTIDPVERRPATLTFVVDVSGSMRQGGRLELVQEALGLLLDQLGPGDRVAVVAFSDEARVLLEPTDDAPAARRAIATLAPEGSTNAEAGLALGYHLAWRERRPGTANRVLLLSDGVANVGATEAESLLSRAAGAAADGIELSTVGVGMGDYSDVLMEQLADRGDGRYAYVGDVAAARRVFVEELAGTLETVAEEARVQVDFDPRVVASWRLLGYENRDLEDRRFRHDDTVDAGEIGAGHAVTALYEVRLVGEPPPGRALAHLKLRYRVPGSGRFSEIERLLRVGDLSPTWEAAPPSLRLAAVAAELAEQLRGSRWSDDTDPAELARHAAAVAAERPGDRRAAELADLAARAAGLARRQ